jgi:hypothetical protein
LDNSKARLDREAAVDVLVDKIWMPLAYVAFGIGFSLGTLNEFIDPEIKRKIEEVRAVIEAEGILPSPIGAKA